MIQPHGRTLVQKTTPSEEIARWEEKARSLPKIVINNHVASDCEMIANGGFSPLQGFMTQAEAHSVIETMQLPNGFVWSIPVLLPMPPQEADRIELGAEIALVDSHDRVIAVMVAQERFTLNLDPYCQQVYKTTDSAHPGVAVVQAAGNTFIGGPLVRLVHRPLRENIAEQYFLDPSQTRAAFDARGWKTIVAFQTRNPIHRAHEYLIKCALEPLDGALIHPLVGETKSDDIPADVRMRCYEVLIEHYFNLDKVMLSVLPAAMRYAGPREAVQHMIIRKNYGCTHMIIGRDHAGVGDYYGTYEAQEMVDSQADRLGIIPIKFEHAVYSRKCESMMTPKTGPNLPDDAVFLSGTKVREMLRAGVRPPKEFTREEVADILIAWATQECVVQSGV